MGLKDLVSIYELGMFVSLIGALSSMIVMRPNLPPSVPVNIKLWTACVSIAAFGIIIIELSVSGIRAMIGSRMP
jgi:hypothetical protein